ncbi:MAG: hypothetical protein IKJ43_04170 [Bacilli bacterium]|nr:hypothetical protein [Bacilli bacterium]
MFDLENILSYTNANIQIIGIFIAIIGGLVATKLLNAKIEKDTLKEKLNKLIKEIDFNKEKKSSKEQKIYQKKKDDYTYYIYDKIIEKDFDVSNYDDYGLSEEQRLSIIDEIKCIMAEAIKIFKEKHKKSEVEEILKEHHIQENTVEYTIYDYVGYETGDSSNGTGPFGMMIPNIADIRMDSRFSSLQENLEERDLNNRIDEVNEILKWKFIEKEDIESKIKAIDNNLNVKKDVILFISITFFSIVIPQIILSIYPLFKDYKWLKYAFAIYSIVTFVISMISMLWYIYKLYKNIKK